MDLSKTTKKTRQQSQLEYLYQLKSEIVSHKPEPSEIGFIPRWMSQVSLPLRNQKNAVEFVRKNGSVKMVVLSPSFIGLPYGNIPRLLLLYLVTSAIRTKKQDILLGSSVSEFLSKLGIGYTGGSTGSFTRYKQQAIRLFSSSFSVFWDSHFELYSGTDKVKSIDISNFQSLPLADSYQLFRSMVPGEGRSYGLGLTVHISDYFWNDLKQHKPIPVDLRIVAGLKHSAFALDIYFWLAYRFYHHSADGIFISSQNLQNQFGTAGSDTHSFMRHFASQLQMISIFMNDSFSYKVNDKGIRIKHISFSKLNSKIESVNKLPKNSNSHVDN
mgnify:FL=1|jgi:hypothetical protein